MSNSKRIAPKRASMTITVFCITTCNILSNNVFANSRSLVNSITLKQSDIQHNLGKSTNSKERAR
jgi:hypothetical protein